MSGRVILFINPESQGVKRKGSRLAAFYKNHPNAADHLLNVESTHCEKTSFKTITFTPDDHLFIEGGDGTVQRTLTHLLSRLRAPSQCPKLSIIAGGLTNQIAANIGLKASQDAHILAAIKQPQTGLRPTPILRLETNMQPPQYGCLFSSGALPFVTEYYEQRIRASQAGGKTAIAATLIKALSGNAAARNALMPSTQLALALRSGDQPITRNGAHLGTIVTTLPSLMMRLDPFWGAGQGDLRIFYAKADAQRLVRNLIGLWLGRKSIDRAPDGLESFQADRLDYAYNGPMALDGETLNISGPLTISATPPLPFVTRPKL